MQKMFNRREFIKNTFFGVAAVAMPYSVLGSNNLFEIEVKSSERPDYKKEGTLRELRNHFRNRIRPTMPNLFKRIYNDTVMFGLDLDNDSRLLSNVFDKIKKDRNFENVAKSHDYREDEKDITFYSPVYKNYGFSGNFNDLEITLYFKTDDEFTKITGMNLDIKTFNLDKNGKNHPPDGSFKGDYRGDLYGEGYIYGAPSINTELQYLKIFTHLEGDKVDIGGLRNLLTRALNKQELIKKDLGLIRQLLKI